MTEKKKLALVMVCKNEEKGLAKAVASARPYVDEVVILVDDTSTDKTIEIARELADTAAHYHFYDDFSDARNFADKFATAEWRIFLDGHETIETFNGVKELLESSADGLLCAIEMENGMTFNYPRIYRKGRKFEGALHEKVNCQMVFNAPGVKIKHDRLGGQSETAAAEREKQRDEMTPRIMGQRVIENKKDTRALFHLGLWAQSKKRYREAIKWYRQYLKYGRMSGERWFVFFNIALCHVELKNLFRAYWYASRCDDENDKRWETEKLKGLISFAGKKYTQAIEHFVKSFNQSHGEIFYKPWKRDDAGTWNIIGEAFFRLNLYEKAGLAFREAAEQSKDEKMKNFFLARAGLLANISKIKYKGEKKLHNPD